METHKNTRQHNLQIPTSTKTRTISKSLRPLTKLDFGANLINGNPESPNFQEVS